MDSQEEQQYKCKSAKLKNKDSTSIHLSLVVLPYSCEKKRKISAQAAPYLVLRLDVRARMLGDIHLGQAYERFSLSFHFCLLAFPTVIPGVLQVPIHKWVN